MNLKNFDTYRISDKTEKALFEKALIFFDTSALLDFYYYSDKTKVEIFEKLFPALKNRLFITPQTEFEYFKNRSTVLKKPISSYDTLFKKTTLQKDSGHIDRIEEIIKEITKLQSKDLNGQFQTLKEKTTKADRHPFVDVSVFKKFDKKLKLFTKYIEGFSENFQTFKQEFQEEISAKKKQLNEDLKVDTVLQGFQKAFKSVNALKHSEILDLIKEGEIRYRNEIPPGYLDENDKIGFQKYGDLIFWKELINKTSDAKKDAILVINDLKEDWWHYDEKDKPSSPRHELIKELKDSTGKKFWMYSMNDFLHKSKLYIETSIEEETIQDVESVEKEWSEEEEFIFVNWIFGYFEDVVGFSHNSQSGDSSDFSMRTQDGKRYALYHNHSSTGRYTRVLIPLRDTLAQKDQIKSKHQLDKLIFLFESSSNIIANKLLQHLKKRTIQKILNSIPDDVQIIIGYRGKESIKVLFDSDQQKSES